MVGVIEWKGTQGKFGVPLFSYSFNAVAIKLRLFCEGKASGYPLFVQAVSARWVDLLDLPLFGG